MNFRDQRGSTSDARDASTARGSRLSGYTWTAFLGGVVIGAAGPVAIGEASPDALPLAAVATAILVEAAVFLHAGVKSGSSVPATKMPVEQPEGELRAELNRRRSRTRYPNRRREILVGLVSGMIFGFATFVMFLVTLPT